MGRVVGRVREDKEGTKRTKKANGKTKKEELRHSNGIGEELRLQPCIQEIASKRGMSGSLHIFRRNVVNGSPFYQVNYNLTGRSFAIVLSPAELDEFLSVVAALPEDLVSAAIREVDTTGKAHILDVEISEGEAVGHGMLEAPSDF